MFTLKKGQESFTPVEGPLAGREFIPGKLYGEIPPGEEKRFMEIKEAVEANGDTMQHHVPGTSAKADRKKAAAGPSSEGGGKS
jgi:hypothetical protein